MRGSIDSEAKIFLNYGIENYYKKKEVETEFSTEKFHEFDPDFKKVVNNTLELKEDMTSLSQKRRKGYAYNLNRMKNIN